MAGLPSTLRLASLSYLRFVNRSDMAVDLVLHSDLTSNASRECFFKSRASTLTSCEATCRGQRPPSPTSSSLTLADLSFLLALTGVGSEEAPLATLMASSTASAKVMLLLALQCASWLEKRPAIAEGETKDTDCFLPNHVTRIPVSRPADDVLCVLKILAVSAWQCCTM